MPAATTGSGVGTAPRSMDHDNTSVPDQGFDNDDAKPKSRKEKFSSSGKSRAELVWLFFFGALSL